jgi:hypothetical protein
LEDRDRRNGEVGTPDLILRRRIKITGERR